MCLFLFCTTDAQRLEDAAEEARSTTATSAQGSTVMRPLDVTSDEGDALEKGVIFPPVDFRTDCGK